MSFLVFKDNTRTSFDNMNEGKELSFGSSFECDIISDAKGVAALHCSFYKKEKYKIKIHRKSVLLQIKLIVHNGKNYSSRRKHQRI